MSDPEYPVTSNVIILPAENPCRTASNSTYEDEINTAMENRLELGEQQLKVDPAVVTSGWQKIICFRNSISSARPARKAWPETSARPIKDNFEFRSLWISPAGFKFQVPLGNRAARSICRRSCCSTCRRSSNTGRSSNRSRWT